MNQTNKIVLAIILSAGLISLAVYFGLKQGLSQKQELVPSPTVTSSTSQPTKTVQPTKNESISSITEPTKKPTPSAITWTKDEVIKALAERTGIAEDKILFSISDQVEKDDKVIIRGTVSEQGTMGGGGFFGYVDQTGIHITYDGQGVPKCSQVNPYDYPTTWADYCLDESGNSIKR